MFIFYILNKTMKSDRIGQCWVGGMNIIFVAIVSDWVIIFIKKKSEHLFLCTDLFYGDISTDYV